MSQYNDLNTQYENNSAENSPTTVDINSVIKGLQRLLHTPKGHDPFNREYGSSLYNLLFENDISPVDVMFFLYMDITNWEPRLDISPSDISIEKIDNNTYKVNCMFRLNNIASGISTTISREE